MFEITKIYQAFGLDKDQEPPHSFEVGDLANLSFHESGNMISIILSGQAEPVEILNHTKRSLDYGIAVFLSMSPGGRICYHLLTTQQTDQTQQTLETLDKLFSDLVLLKV